MPQPPSNDRIAQALIDLYTEAHGNLIDQLDQALAAGNRRTQVARLRELIRANETIVDSLLASTSDWLAASIPELHAAGAGAAAEVIGSSFAWAAPHVEAVNQLAGRVWDDVAANLLDVRADTRRALQDMVRDATRASLLESKTATQAARTLAQHAAADGLWSVEYANGARHTIADYADSVIRTTTAEAYNQGSIEQCRGDGIEQVEYVDGPGCHVGPGHDNGPLANGLVVALEDVVTISHPRCRRALLPVVDGAVIPASARDPGPARAPEAEPLEVPVLRRLPRQRRDPRRPRTPRPMRPAAKVRTGPAPGTVSPRSTFQFPDEVTERSARYESLLNDVGRVHGMADDGFPATDLLIAPSNGNNGGHFWVRPDGRPEIKINELTPDHDAFNLLHELGHRIDSAPGRAGRASGSTYTGAGTKAGRRHPLPAAETAFRDFLSAAKKTTNIKDAKKLFPGQRPQFLKYHRNPQEIWARAYSQYMAEKLGGSAKRGMAERVGFNPHLQWSDEEFAELVPLVENVLRAMELMK